jgi:ketosteroid isomerase-like protein
VKARSILFNAFLAALLLSGCQQHAGSGSTQIDSLLNTDKAFSAASVKEGFAAAFSDYAIIDATLLPQGSAAVGGKPQIAQSLAAIPAGTQISWTPQAADVSGKLGYTWGVYTSTGTNSGGQTTLAYGKYLSIWKRENGEWKLNVMMTNQSPGPAG